MNWWVVGIVVAFIAAIVVAVKLGWIDLSNKAQRGSGTMSGAIGGSFDEIFAPARHEAQQELDRQSLLPAPAPLPGDRGDTGWEGGKITLDLGTAGNGQRAEGRAPSEDGRATAAAAPRSRGSR
ncbi:hypothetical protein [Leifsonia shinshuensis]|uniref:hypothetical protein n=1 Tax=Leifsonia TaxID=110932 RepID=UPI002861368E|nr:hypothetical protein [Leifsonia shinshuensis]MDR6972526.1 hypothetical protein [Leifsonia shinshuensis]